MQCSIQILGLDAIKVDPSIQSRAETYPHYMREFSEAMLRGDEFPPVTTFFDDRDYWLADGRHRWGARMALAKLDRSYENIKAEVWWPGSRHDAIVHSAGANQKFSIPRTSADIARSVAILRALPEWAAASDGAVAKHVGITPTTARKWTLHYFRESGLKLPRNYPGRKRVGGNFRIHSSTDAMKGTRYYTYVDMKYFYLGKTRDEALFRLRNLRDSLKKGGIPPVSDEQLVRGQVERLAAKMRRLRLASLAIDLDGESYRLSLKKADGDGDDGR